MTQKRAFSGHSRGHRLTWRLIGFAILCLVSWLVGLLWFAADLPTSVAEPGRETDAIVVLTGGRGRVHQGLDLLAEQRAKKLFISGVYRGVDVRELLRISQQSPADLECCIALGYEADSTRGNAIETADWLREQGMGSLRLVTSAYHMPRSLLEFRRVMPDVMIVPHPVFPQQVRQREWWRWSGSASLIVTEYNKYVIALARGVLRGET
jgi:uncharacterized SAM-binding protein YcdF (DUF218 family)